MAQNIYGVDIGTSNLKMCCNEKGRILNEKNIIAIANKKEMLAFGDEAYDMYEKAPENIEVSFPVKFGVIADIENMQTLLVSFFNKINDDKKFSGNTDFYIAVPTDVTEVEKRAFYELVADSKVKAKNIYIVDKPVADAIGAGLDVTKSKGIMVVNIGAETTEISVISLGGIVISKSIKIGNKLDDSIISIIRKEYNLVIGSKTAEGLKKELGSAVKAEEKFAPGFGRNVLSGLPVSVQISSDVIYSAIVDPLHSIMDSIKVILERTPPELAADIIKDGIYVTGGTSNISNLQQFINKETNLNVNIVENPAESVVRGLIDVVNKPEFSKIPYTPQDKKYE